MELWEKACATHQEPKNTTTIPNQKHTLTLLLTTTTTLVIKDIAEVLDMVDLITLLQLRPITTHTPLHRHMVAHIPDTLMEVHLTLMVDHTADLTADHTVDHTLETALTQLTPPAPIHIQVNRD